MKLIKVGVAALLLVTVAVVAALMTGPSSGQAADHVDAPGLTPPGGNFQLDLTDIYAWRSKSGNTVLAANVNGLAKAGAKPVFASGVPSVKGTKGVAYWLRIDNNGDAVSDVDLRITFSKPDKKGVQKLMVDRNGKRLLVGKSTAPGKKIVTVNKQNGVKAFAGLRDDPFFFDLAGFLDITAALDADKTNDAKSFVGCKDPRTGLLQGLQRLVDRARASAVTPDGRGLDQHRRLGRNDREREAGRPHGSPRDQHGLHPEQPVPG